MRSIIVGGASTKMFKNSGLKPIDLYLEAIKLSLDETGVQSNQIDGMVTGGSFVKPQFMYTNIIAEKLGIKLNWAGSVDAGGANAISALILADAIIKTGKASMIIVADADSIGTFYKNNPIEFFKKACLGMNSLEKKFSDPTKPIVAYMYNEVTKWYAKKFIAKHGENSKKLLRQALMQVAVVMSKHASKNPLALNQKILTIENITQSSIVASWLNAYECARPADGGGAIIVASEKKARELNCKPVYILGSGESFDHKNRIDYDSDWGCKKAGKKALEEAGVTVHNIDTAFLYDCFPITVIKALEDLGFYEEFSAPFHVLNDRLELGKSNCPCPINTHGGLLSCGAPWAAASIFGIVEIIKQLQNGAAGRQIANCKYALAYGNGGFFSASSVVILSNKSGVKS